MRITTSLLPPVGRITGQTNLAVVIDVLRATSVMTTALAAGATEIITCREISEAFELADAAILRPLLCGERGCKPIDGFDLGNSPAEYTPEQVQNRALILTTTNGTAAIESAANASRLITASFLNLSAVVESLQRFESIHLVCAGTDGWVTTEDVLLAGAIVHQCEARYQARCDEDDESMLARQLWRSWFAGEQTSAGVLPEPQQLSQRLRETRGGRNLLRVGFEQDLERCAAIDSQIAVPELKSREPMSFGLQAS